jgi:hypothetical protein
MKPDFFVVFADARECEMALEEIHNSKGGVWAAPITNAFNKKCIIPWNIEELSELSHILDAKEKITRDESIKQDFNVDFYKGPFAQAERKFEEAQFIAEDFDNIMALNHFPVFKANFYGCQGALYGVREALARKTIKLGGEASTWWKSIENSLRQKEPFIHLLHVDYNRDKHGDGSSILHPSLKMYEYKGAAIDIISGEGAFRLTKTVHGRLVRSFVTGLNASLNVTISLPSIVVSGEELVGMPLKSQIMRVLDVHDQWISEAKNRFE